MDSSLAPHLQILHSWITSYFGNEKDQPSLKLPSFVVTPQLILKVLEEGFDCVD